VPAVAAEVVSAVLEVVSVVPAVVSVVWELSEVPGVAVVWVVCALGAWSLATVCTTA
jgi:hypothetical protein